MRNYIIEYKVLGSFKWIRANEGERVLETYYKVTGLHDDLEYEFRIAAENKGGIGPFSEVTMSVKAKDPEGMTFVLMISACTDIELNNYKHC